MRFQETKADFLRLIENSPNTKAFYSIYDQAKNALEKPKEVDILDMLTEEEVKSLDESIKEIDAGKGIPHEQVMRELKQWLTE